MLFLGLPVATLVARSVVEGALREAAASEAVLAALWLSLATSAASLVLTVLLGLPLALVLARRRFRGRWLAEAIVDLPIVLPPSVAGLALLLVFGRRGLLGEPLGILQQLEIPFTTIAVVLAQTFVAAPFFVRSARTGLASVDRDLEDAARVDGATEPQLFRAVTLPLARDGDCSESLVMSSAPGPRRVRGDDHVRRQHRGADPDPAAGRLHGGFQAGNLETSIAAAAILVLAASVSWSPCGSSLGPLARGELDRLMPGRSASRSRGDLRSEEGRRADLGPEPARGTVRTITEGAVMTEVVIDLDAGQEVVAAITTESARRLGLAVGRPVVAVVKSTEVMVAVED